MSFFHLSGHPKNTSGKSRGLLALAALWLGGAFAGWVGVTWLASRPGHDLDAPEHWPAASSLVRNSEGPTLIMFAHPKCPCTEASLEELARILEVSPPRMTATVVFFQPDSVDESWSHTRLWDAAGAMPKVQRVVDGNGREARRFQASTAGRTLLYGQGGELLFAGGITQSRGHRGDNPGESAIVALLQAQQTPTRRTPAFGCPLFEIATNPR